MIITPRQRDLGGFCVRRVLPFATHRMVGPFIFFDHMGPAEFQPGNGIDVRPHPHVNLATVTYLFEGVIHHRDSLGSDQLIQPGAINWMTAGHGIVHSERTPDDVRKTGSKISGIQCWVALPDEYEEVAPEFAHHEADALPEFEIDGASVKLLLGTAFNRESPVKLYSQLFYLEVKIPQGSRFSLPLQRCEAAAYVVTGKIRAKEEVDQFSMIINDDPDVFVIEALEDAHVMIIGGKPVGKRFIYWNFVSSSQEKIEQAKQDWLSGPGPQPKSRFPLIPGDHADFIPLPADTKNPKGTIM